jgi:organic radical activating enzyme
MNQLRKIWVRIFPPIQPLPAGIYHYQAPANAPFPYRLHLRIDPNGEGILILNASTVVHLNHTATEYAFHLVQNTEEEAAVLEISRRYNVRKEIIKRDYQDLIDRLKTLIDTPDLDPVSFLNFERQDPYSSTQTAPYRIDCALTYRLPDDGVQHIAPLERVSRELLASEWKQIMDKAWNAGVPHAIFTGGEPTLRPDLAELIAHGEQLGMVTGLITNGLRLAEKDYLHELLQSGLDHLMILLDPGEEGCWEGLRDTLAEDIAVTVHVTLNRRTLAQFDEILDRLVHLGVKNISLSTESLEDKDALQEKRQAVAEREMRLVWDLPVPYTHFHPVALELAADITDVSVVSDGAGKAWIYVEPDGDVLRGQGYYQEVLGNLVTDAWETVWAAASAAVPAVG